MTTPSFVQHIKKTYLVPERAWPWIVITLLVKVVIFLLIFYQSPGPDGNYIWLGGDTADYFQPIESLIAGRGYQPDYRMPGYGVAYLFVRSVFDPAGARIALVVLQWMTAILSVYYLAKAILNFTSSRLYFYVVFFLFAASSFTNVYDNTLLTESFTTSALIFCVYFLSEYKKSRKAGYLLVAGIFLCWTCFLRPVLFPILIIPGIYLVAEGFTEKVRRFMILARLAVFFTPLLLCEGMWIARNYNLYQRFVPLSRTVYSDYLENSYRKELIDFVISWGGDRTWWNPVAEIRWFMGPWNLQGSYDKELPGYIYTSAFNRDSLLAIRNSITVIEDPATDSLQRANINASVKKTLAVYTRSIKEEKSALFFIWTRFILLKKFFNHSGTHNLLPAPYSELTAGGKVLKIFYSAFYVAVIAGGCLGIAMIFLSHQLPLPLKLLITGLTLYFVLIFPIVGHIEYRYFVPGYPFMLACACFPLSQLISRVTRNEKDIRSTPGV